MGASVYVGVLGKNYLRAITYYRHSSSTTYFQDDHSIPQGGPGAVSNANFNFTGIAIAYGITKRLTVEVDAGYFINKTQKLNMGHSLKGYGFSNGNLTFKYGTIIKPVQQIELTTGFGLRFPFSTEPMFVNGSQLNIDLQPSTNAFGVSEMIFFNKGFPAITLRVFTINRYDYNFANTSNYRFGNILMNSIFVSKKLFRYCFAIIQIRNEWKTNDKDMKPVDGSDGKILNSGYDLVTLSPQLSYSIAGKWNFTASYDFPVYKHYNGKQLTPSYSFAISLTRDFNLGRKTPVVQIENIK